MTKYLIIGHGIAGAVLAGKLMDLGKEVYVADEYRENSSSRVAAGLFNPITGKRLSLTWEAIHSWEALYAFYPAWEQKLGKKFFFEKPVIRILKGQDQLNDWTARSGEWPYRWFLDEKPIQQIQLGEALYSGLKIKRSGWLDTNTFLDAMQSYLESNGNFMAGEINLEEIQFQKDGTASYRGKQFSHVIYCGGWRPEKVWPGAQLPFTPMRGEIIDVAHNDFPEDHVLVKNHFLLPLGSGLFRIGSTYDWRITSPVTTAEGLDALWQFALEMMGAEVRMVAHRAGVRPAVKDRRPLIGKMDEQKNLYIFNGFGSKAVSLAPWLSEKLLDSINNGVALPAEANVARFL